METTLRPGQGSRPEAVCHFERNREIGASIEDVKDARVVAPLTSLNNSFF